MNTHQIRTFIAVAKEGSFSKAAEREFLSASALLQQIQTLEKEIGCPLFDRCSSGVKLNAAGEIFLETAESVLNTLENTIIQCNQIMNQAGCEIIIGFYRNNIPVFTPYAVEQFRKAHSDIKVTIRPTVLEDALTEVLNGHIDICEYAYSAEMKNAELCFKEFYRSSRYALVSRSNPLSAKKVLRREDLVNQKISVHSLQWTPDLVAWCRKKPKIQLTQVPCTIQIVYDTCIEGNVYLMPEQSVKNYPSLAAVPIEPDFPTVYGFVYRKNCSAQVRIFLDSINLKDGLSHTAE